MKEMRRKDRGIDQAETKYAVSLEIEDETTLRDIIGQLKSS